MPSQYGAILAAQRETKQLARRSADFVKKSFPFPPPEKSPPIIVPPMAAHANLSDIMVPELLQKGITMTKISEGKQTRVDFRIDPDEGRISYKSSKEHIIPIESIKEMRMGPNAKYYRVQFKLPEEMDDRWITVIYILDGAYRTLHFVTDTQDVFQLWSDALKKLYAIRQGLMRGLGNVDVRQTIWERQYWKGADEEGDQVLDFDDVERLCMRLNVNVTGPELSKMFKDADANGKGSLDFSEFQAFVGKLKRRPELEGIYGKLCTSNEGKLDSHAFVKFMREFQKSMLSESEIKAVFTKYATSSDPTANEPAGLMTLDGFSTFLLSPENSAFSEQDRPVWQDMKYSISDYYISSSHNTYLVGHQLVGVSTIEGYIRALLHSCRSVELDIYDGDREPVVYHGKTLTSKVSLRDICQAIAKYAFVTSPYPLLISAEVHCGIEQQDKIVDVMLEAFGPSLVQAPYEGRPAISMLPSPEDLKYKYLLKAKNLYVVEELALAQAARLAEKTAAEKATADKAQILSSDESDNEAEALLKEGISDLKNTWKKIRGKDDKAPSKPKAKMSFRLASLLVYTVGVKCHGLEPDVRYAPEHIFSLSENSANRHLKANMTNLVKHTHTHLVRVYPKGTRVNSTNYGPHRYWAAGCQVVAINWQTFDLGYLINQAMFQRNGRSGLVLKPEALRCPRKGMLTKRTQHFFDVTIISAQQLPRLRDSNGQEIIEKSIVDPFVQVSLHIPDWSNSPFLPESATAAGAKYSPSSDATTTKVSSARTISFNTKVIKNNGFNPIWQEELNLPFDCVGDMKELIFVEFAVRQQGKDEGSEPLGIYCVPLGCLEQGFRHLPLHDAQLTQHLFSTLFVQISIRDIQ